MYILPNFTHVPTTTTLLSYTYQCKITTSRHRMAVAAK